MKLFFNYYGDFSGFDREDLCFGAMEFDSNGKHWIIDLVGEVEYDFSKKEISGRFKGDIEVLSPKEPVTDEELADIILHMNKSTFQYNILDDGEEPIYRKFEGALWFNNKTIEITKKGSQPMKVYELFDILRAYPDWDVNIFVKDSEKKILENLVDVDYDEDTNSLIIIKKEN